MVGEARHRAQMHLDAVTKERYVPDLNQEHLKQVQDRRAVMDSEEPLTYESTRRGQIDSVGRQKHQILLAFNMSDQGIFWIF